MSSIPLKKLNGDCEYAEYNHKENDDDEEYKERFPSMGQMLKRQANSCCSAKMLKRRLPIVGWAPNYQKRYLFEDFVAGVTVGLTAIPQSIAYAVVAGLEPQYGLYSAFMGCFIYVFFGSCKAVTVGPTAIMAIMTQPHITGRTPDFAILLAFLSGIITLLLGLLNLGFLVQFISASVISGFTTAAAITIASGQIKALLGLPGKGTEFIEAWINFFENITHINWTDTVLGIGSIAILLLLKKCGEHKGKFKSFAKYISLSRNALIVFLGTLIAFLFSLYNLEPFTLTGNIGKGFPPIGLPPFSTEFHNRSLDFADMINELGSAVITIPLISIIETVTIATIFCEKGSAVDATQEMIAVGFCNIVGSFFSSMPTTGSFTRSAVNYSSGVRTPLGGIFTGILVLLALGLLTSTFYFIPKATLAAVIIAAMFPMMEFHEIIKTFKTKRIDVVPLIITMVACLTLGLEFGILVGVASNLFIVLLSTARPTIDLEKVITADQELLVITPHQSLIFSSSDYFRNKVAKYIVEHEHVETVVINGEFVQNIDMTAMKKLSNMIDSFEEQGKKIILWNWNNKTAYSLVIRYKRDYKCLFKFSINVDDLIYQLKAEVPNNHVSDIITR